jgi:hypothetical protein
MPLRIFDIEAGDYRDATQADLDELQAIRTAYGRIQSRFAEDRAVLVAELKAIRSRAGLPNEVTEVVPA